MNPQNPSDINTPTQQPVGHGNRLGAVRIQLRSQLPSDVRRGMEQARRWLQENPEDKETYGLLLNAIEENPRQRDEIRNLIQDIAQKGSEIAAEILQAMDKLSKPESPTAESFEKPISGDNDQKTKPASEPDLMADADDAYYAAEFDKAIRLYRQVLQKEPGNQRARQQLDKAELNRIANRPNIRLPREAMQYYRRARSFIAARDTNSAISMLSAAIEEAQASHLKFAEAEDLLYSQQDLLTAVEYRGKADGAIQQEKWEEAVDLYGMALRLDPFDEVSKNMCSGLQGLFETEAFLGSLADRLGDQAEREENLRKITDTIKINAGIKKIASTVRFNAIRAKYSLYKAEADLQKSGRLKVLASQRRIKDALDAAKSVLTPGDPAIKYVEAQLKQLQPLRIGSLLMLIVFAAVIGYIVQPSLTAMMISPTPTLDSDDLTSVFTLTETPVPGETITLVPTFTVTIQPSATNTLLPSIPTLTPIPFSGWFVDTPLIHAFDIPNGTWIGELQRNQVVKILDKKLVSDSFWYFCEWDLDGTTKQGWILAIYIKAGPTPTPVIQSPTPKSILTPTSTP